MPSPEFENILKVCHREKPSRTTRFEFFLNDGLIEYFTGKKQTAPYASLEWTLLNMECFYRAGYDYVPVSIPGFAFDTQGIQKEKSISLNDGAVITDRESFENYPWPDPDRAEYAILDAVEKSIPKGMKVIVHGPCGVLEAAEKLAGFENLCMMTMIDPELATDLFVAIGDRLARYYEQVVNHPVVGAILGNDDWGFKTQTMLSPEALRTFVFPGHAKIVALAHRAAKPALLHSCGNLGEVYDDIIDDIGYDAKHSFEDGIVPVEQFYEKYHDRIAVLGGIDVDYLCRASSEDIARRARNLVALTQGCTGYALGSGNSIPDYLPREHYLALVNVS